MSAVKKTPVKTRKQAKKGASRKRRDSNARRKDPRGTKEWTLWVIAARDIILETPQEAAARGISRSGRRLRAWMQHPAWQDALKEAEQLCLQGIKHKSLRAVDKSVGMGNATLGLEMLKLTMPALQPVRKHEHSGSVVVHLTDAERAQKAAELLGRVRERKARE